MDYEDKTRALPVGEQGPEPDLLRKMLNELVQETIRSEFDHFLSAAPYERTAARYGREVRIPISITAVIPRRPRGGVCWTGSDPIRILDASTHRTNDSKTTR